MVNRQHEPEWIDLIRTSRLSNSYKMLLYKYCEGHPDEVKEIQQVYCDDYRATKLGDREFREYVRKYFFRCMIRKNSNCFGYLLCQEQWNRMKN